MTPMQLGYMQQFNLSLCEQETKTVKNQDLNPTPSNTVSDFTFGQELL